MLTPSNYCAPTWLRAVPLIGTLLATAGAGAPPLVVDLSYTPREDEISVNPVAEAFGEHLPVPIALRFTREAAFAPGSEEIGESGHQTIKTRIYGTRSVTSFLEDGATKQFKEWGMPLSNEAQLILQGEVKEFFLKEKSLYRAAINIGYSVRNREGKTLWEADIRSDSTVFGMGMKAENYRQAFSDALRKNLRSLIAFPGFQTTIAEKVSPKEVGSTMTPAVLKDEVLKLMKESLDQELIVAFVRQARISPPFSTEDVLGWKAAGISKEVTAAALGAAASSPAP